MKHLEPQRVTAFQELGINSRLLHVLHRQKFLEPTAIQHQAIPLAIAGKDIIGIAQTGTGKTFAFGLPLLQRLADAEGSGLIIVPTRELAYQIDQALAPFSAALGLRTAVFVGGASLREQRESLRRNPRILLATPGRLNDHLEQGTVSLGDVRILVLDEADRMLDMGFKPQIERILRHVPRERQTLLFSATMPQDIVKLGTAHMKLPLRIEVAPPGTTVAQVEQELFIVRREEKLRLLEKLLQEYEGSALVFSRTKFGAKKIVRAVRAMGHRAAEIHSNRSLAQRREALEGFKTGRYRVLIATDIAARGIDVTGIEVVINFDLPPAGDYVHRIGRTGRAGREGRAISFASPDQREEIRSIERFIRTSLRTRPLPQLPPPRAILAPEQPAAARRAPNGRSAAARSPQSPHRRFRPHGRGQRKPGRRSAWHPPAPAR